MHIRWMRWFFMLAMLSGVLRTAVFAMPDDGSQVDVLVLIGQNARAIAGGSDMQAVALIDAAFDAANLAYAAAGVNTQVRIVGYQPVFFLEQINGDPDADLDSLTHPSDGVLDEVHALRDAYAADLVVLAAGSWFAIYDGNGHAVPPFDPAMAFVILEMRAIDTNAALKWTTRALGVDALPPFTQPQIDALNVNRITVANYRESDTRTVAAAELAINGGFELDTDVDGVPDFWAAKNWMSGDTRTCSGPVGSNGCVVQLKVNDAPTGKLKTVIPNPPVALMDEVRASVQAAANKSACVTLMLVVKYAGGGTDKPSTTLCITQADGWAEVGTATVSTDQVVKVKLVLTAAGQGKVWLDDASIQTVPLASQGGAR